MRERCLGSVEGLPLRAQLCSLQTSDGQHHRWVPIAEAERRERNKECRRVRLPGRRNLTYRLVPAIHPSKSGSSPASLTVSDTLALVGIFDSRSYLDISEEHGAALARAAKRRVREKLSAFMQSSVADRIVYSPATA
jgi:hypothetical protein